MRARGGIYYKVPFSLAHLQACNVKAENVENVAPVAVVASPTTMAFDVDAPI